MSTTFYAVVIKPEGYTPNVRYFYHQKYNCWVELKYKIFNTQKQAIQFIDKHINKMDWEFMSTDSSSFSQKFIRKYFDHFFIQPLCHFYPFSDEFMREYKDELNWDEICEFHPSLNYEFIKEMEDIVDIEKLKHNFNIREDIIEKMFM